MMDVEQVPAHEWETWRDANDAVLLDIREPTEWAQGVLPGAIQISMSALLDHIDEVPQTRPSFASVVRVNEASRWLST